MMSASVITEENPIPFFVSEYYHGIKFSCLLSSCLNIPDTNLFVTTNAAKQRIEVLQYDHGQFSYYSEIRTPNRFPFSLYFHPKGYLICGASHSKYKNCDFLYFDISSGIQQYKEIVPFSGRNNVKIGMTPRYLVALDDGSLVCSSYQSFCFLGKAAKPQHYEGIKGIGSLILHPENQLLVITSDSIELISLDDLYENRTSLPSRKTIAMVDASISCGCLLASGELALNQGLGTSKTILYKLDITSLTLNPIRKIATEEYVHGITQTADHRLLYIHRRRLLLSEADITFQCEKKDVEAALNTVLTRDPAGIVRSYLHTESFFKPAKPLVATVEGVTSALSGMPESKKSKRPHAHRSHDG